MVAASVAIISGARRSAAGMASSIESVSYELGSLAGVTVLGTILTAVYTNTIHLPATAPAKPPAASTKPAPPQAPPRRPSPHPAGSRRQRLRQRLHPCPAITAIALAAGSAFTYRYLKRQPITSTQQAQYPEQPRTAG